MLLSFSVENFRSIKERQTLSMIASSKSSKNYTELPPPNDFKVLRTSVVYGANAAGKSNLIKAMEFVHDYVVTNGGGFSDEDLDAQPFLFDKNTRNQCTEFEIDFVIDDVRYNYEFAFDSSRVIFECLIAFPKGRAQRWFSRSYDESNEIYDYKFSEYLFGQKNVWRNATRDNALFLSTAVNLNSDQLKPLYNWFKEKVVVTDRRGWSDSFTRKFCYESVEKKDKVVEFLKSADISIQDIIVEPQKIEVSIEDFPDSFPENIRKEILADAKDKVFLEVKTVHRTSDGGSVHLNLQDESEGTKKLFSAAGPLMDSMGDGNILIMDELHESLHPKIVNFIVELFNSPELNPKNAQLIFTTHDTSILNEDVFTTDQVWFCEKNESQETELYSLSDFKLRKGRSNFEAAYLSGKFGALPFISSFKAI